MFKLTPREILSVGAVVSVTAIDDLSIAVDLSHALVEGGIPTFEITLRTPAGLDVIRLIAKEVPNIIVGAGTATNSEQLKVVEDAGTAFAISPGLHESLTRASYNSDTLLILGVATPGEVQLALEYGIDTLKLFPAGVVGGKAMFKTLCGLYTDVRFCPTGGISLATAPDYSALPNVLCVGGSWLAPKEAVKDKDWDTITRLTREASALKAKTQFKAIKGRLKASLRCFQAAFQNLGKMFLESLIETDKPSIVFTGLTVRHKEVV